MTAQAELSAYDWVEQPRIEPMMPLQDRAGRMRNEHYRLLLSLALALLLHGLGFLLLLRFAHPPKEFDEPPRVLSVVWMKAAQAGPTPSAPKTEIRPKPKLQPVRPEPSHAQPQPRPLPVLVASESPAPPVAETPPALVPPLPATAPATVLPGVAEPAPAPPAPPGPVAAPRFDVDYLSNPELVYPEQSRLLGEEGRVLVSVHVTEDGNPDAVTVARSSGFSRLDQASAESIWKWKFAPARQDGKAVAATVIVPINFTLRR
jgi:protein TonB